MREERLNNSVHESKMELFDTQISLYQIAGSLRSEQKARQEIQRKIIENVTTILDLQEENQRLTEAISTEKGNHDLTKSLLMTALELENLEGE